MRAAVIAVLFGDLIEVSTDDLENLMGVGEDIFQLGDGLDQGFVLVLNFLAFQRRQTAKLHIEDRLRLDFGQVKAGHQIRLGDVRVL